MLPAQFNDIACLAALRDVTPAYTPAGVSVYRLELDFQRGELDALLGQLTGPERDRCLRYRQQADRIRFAASRVVLRRLLAQRLHLHVAAIHLAIDAFGKPWLANEGRLFFNLSHSENFALIALSAHGPVGVDIEAAPVAASASPIEQALQPQERRYCEESADTQAFFRVWSGKEAVLKALGLGIASHLQSVSVIPVAPSRYAVSLHLTAPPVQAWQLPAPAGFVAALAALKPVSPAPGPACA